jgi:hypothetical protein
MAIEKKSLISNRAATKKAVVAKAKPEVTNKTGVTRLGGTHGRTYLSGKTVIPAARLRWTRLSAPKV